MWTWTGYLEIIRRRTHWRLLTEILLIMINGRKHSNVDVRNTSNPGCCEGDVFYDRAFGCSDHNSETYPHPSSFPFLVSSTIEYRRDHRSRSTQAWWSESSGHQGCVPVAPQGPPSKKRRSERIPGPLSLHNSSFGREKRLFGQKGCCLSVKETTKVDDIHKSSLSEPKYFKISACLPCSTQPLGWYFAT